MRPIAVALCGLPGSGKSTLAGRLSAETGWQRLDRDELRREVFPDGGGYSGDGKRELGKLLRERALETLARPESVILDGMTFARAEERNRFSTLVLQAGGEWRLVWLDCEVAVARQRVKADNAHPAEDRNAALVDRVAARFEKPSDAIRVDAHLSTDEQLRALLAALDITRPRE